MLLENMHGRSVREADNQERDFVDWRREGHGGGDWTESSRSLQVKSLTSEQRNSCLFFQLLLLLFRKSCLSLLAECSVTAGPLDR